MSISKEVHRTRLSKTDAPCCCHIFECPTDHTLENSHAFYTAKDSNLDLEFCSFMNGACTGERAMSLQARSLRIQGLQLGGNQISA